MELVIFTNNINSSEFDKSKTNNPVLRKNKIIECIKKNIKNVTLIEIEKRISTKLIENVHDKQYLKFLKESYTSFAKSADISWNDRNDGLVPCNFYRTMPNALVPIYKFSGFYGSDVMTPIYKNTWNNVMISANQAYQGATYLHNNNSKLVYILATSPGHHAKKSEYGGYCFVNNIVVAAQCLIELSNKKIGILDLDYHAGNGTYDMTLTNKNIFAYSLHCDPKYDYPSFDGIADEYNYILPPKCDWNVYKNILTMVCESMMRNNIDILLIAFGGDTFKFDPDAIPIGRFTLELSSYTEMGKLIKQYFKKTPIMITQEGGYDMDNIGDIVTLFINGLMNPK